MPSAVPHLPTWFQILLFLAPAVGSTCAAVGLFLSIIQARRTNAQSRAELVATSLKDFVGDSEMYGIFFSIESGEFKYGEGFRGSPAERQVDKLLQHFAIIALAWERGLLSLDELRPLQYFICRVLQNPGIQEYQSFLEQFAERAAAGESPFRVLKKLGRKLEETHSK